MVRPEQSTRESAPRRWALLVAGCAAAAAVLMATCALLAWWSGTGPLGFGVALAVGLVVLVGALLVRSSRRSARSLRRLELAAQRDRRATEQALGRLGDQLAALQRSGEKAAEAAGARRKRDTEQAMTLETLVAGQLEQTRALARGVTPDRFEAQLVTQLRQQQAMLNLFQLVPPRGLVPTMGGWAASADVVLVLVAELLRLGPRLVVECGSGVSTLWLALAIEHYRLACRVVSLDHDPHFAEQTRRTLRAHGVAGHVEVRDAPLAPPDGDSPTGLEGHQTSWYDPAALTGLAEVGLVFVDGPPDATGPLVRLPAVPRLAPLLAEQATILLDDVIRPGEQEVVERWRLLLPDFELEWLPLQKRSAAFRRGTNPVPR